MNRGSSGFISKDDLYQINKKNQYLVLKLINELNHSRSNETRRKIIKFIHDIKIFQSRKRTITIALEKCAKFNLSMLLQQIIDIKFSKDFDKNKKVWLDILNSYTTRRSKDKTSYFRALNTASYYGNVNMVKILVIRGANPFTKAAYGEDALTSAREGLYDSLKREYQNNRIKFRIENRQDLSLEDYLTAINTKIKELGSVGNTIFIVGNYKETMRALVKYEVHRERGFAVELKKIEVKVWKSEKTIAKESEPKMTCNEFFVDDNIQNEQKCNEFIQNTETKDIAEYLLLQTDDNPKLFVEIMMTLAFYEKCLDKIEKVLLYKIDSIDDTIAGYLNYYSGTKNKISEMYTVFK